MKLVWPLLVLTVGCIACVSLGETNVVITAPVDKSTYIAVNGHSAPVEVKYTTQKDNQPDNTSFCFEINRVLFDADSKYLEGCFEDDNRPLTINEVEVGDYEFISYLKDAGDKNLASTVSHIMFSVVSYKDAVPRILLHSVPLHVLSGEEHTAEVSLSYTLETSVLDSKKFNVCMWITSDSSANKMDKECVSSAQMDLVLKGMTSGDHTLHAALQPVGQSELVESSIVSTVIRVAELSIVPLKLALVGYDSSDGASAGSYSLEFVVDAADPIKIRLAIQGPKAAISKSLVCLMIDGNLAAAAAAAEVREYSRDSCYPALTTDEFTIQRNAPGRYAISFYLLPAVATGGGGKADVPSSVLQVRVEVHKQEEFVPTYDWQPLRPWHSIPAGIETRLPVGVRGGAIKEARIPQPWRLQLPLPSPPCRYFLRMDLTRHSTVRDIMMHASVQCKQPANCFLVYAGDSLLGSEVTVEECDFFQRTQNIEFDPACFALS